MGEIFGIERAPQPLEFSGERFTSEASGLIEIEHVHRYFLVRELCRGKDVLDVASGEGYGAAILSRVARSVVGVELDAGTVLHAQQSYPRENLTFVCGDARNIPLPDSSVDVAVSFETLEHLNEHDVFLSELKRVLRPGGIAVVSTPDRDIYSPAGRPANPHHVHELTRDQFVSLLTRNFCHVQVYGQRAFTGSTVLPLSAAIPEGLVASFERRDPAHVEADSGLPRAVYLVAVVSKEPLQRSFSASLYISGAVPDGWNKAGENRCLLQVFVAGDKTYSEDRSVKKNIPLNTWQSLSFDLKDAGHGQIRIDPADCQSVTEISNIALIESKSGRVLWPSSMAEGWNQIQVSGSAIATQVEGSFLILSPGTDPQLLLPPLVNCNAEVRLELSLRVDANPGVLFEVLDQQYRYKLKESDRYVEHWKLQVRASANERMLVLADLRQAVAERDYLSRELTRAEDTMQASAKLLRADAADLKEQVIRLHENVASAEAQLRAEEALNRRIIHSLSWRVTQPIRGSMERLRKLLRG